MIAVACILACVLAQGVHKPSNAAIIKSSSSKLNQDGSYQFQFDSDNGISTLESGIGGQVVQGSTQWIARSGEPLAVSFIADKDGYRPTGKFIIYF